MKKAIKWLILNWRHRTSFKTIYFNISLLRKGNKVFFYCHCYFALSAKRVLLLNQDLEKVPAIRRHTLKSVHCIEVSL